MIEQPASVNGVRIDERYTETHDYVRDGKVDEVLSHVPWRSLPKKLHNNHQNIADHGKDGSDDKDSGNEHLSGRRGNCL